MFILAGMAVGALITIMSAMSLVALLAIITVMVFVAEMTAVLQIPVRASRLGPLVDFFKQTGPV